MLEITENQEPVELELRAKGPTASLAEIIEKFAEENGFDIKFQPRRGGAPDWRPPGARIRRFGPIHKVDDAKLQKTHQVGRIELQQLPDDICLISLESKEFLDQADELEAFYVALYEHLKGLGLYLPPVRAHPSA